MIGILFIFGNGRAAPELTEAGRFVIMKTEKTGWGRFLGRMSTTRKKTGREFLQRIYGGLPMRWGTVLVSAVAAALLTAVFLVVPVFKGTSFARMGATFEAWFFLSS